MLRSIGFENAAILDGGWEKWQREGGPLRILSASGQLGYGVIEKAFRAGIERDLHLIGADMGSVDPGFGTAYLAHVVGEKKAREIWYLCRRYTAQEAVDMGLANAVFADDLLDAEVLNWCAELNQRSPTAIAIAKKSFNADTDHIKGIGGLGMQALALYYNTDESKEGVNALQEKRTPDFRRNMAD